jgi:hypothetical protein
MDRVLQMLKLLAVGVVLVAGGLAFWRWRETANRAWVFLGGLDGIMDSADRFVETARPVKDLVTQAAHLK